MTTRRSPNISIGTAQAKTQGIQIHPIFGPDKFSPQLDYKTAFQEAVLLTSRLLKSQQSYHWLFAVFFGTNKRSRVPYAFRYDAWNAPEECTTNRGIGELTQEEMETVDQQLTDLSRRVHSRVSVKQRTDTTLAKCEPRDADMGQQGCRSTISIMPNFYNLRIRSGGHQASGERAPLFFAMATTLLHEMAHAAHFHIMGRRHEDFFEEALVAEAGFEYVSRIFGMSPNMRPTSTGLLGSQWVQWQNILCLNQDSYPVDEKCRDTKKLSMFCDSYRFDSEFAEKLLNDEWWEGAEDRSAFLIPDFLLRKENVFMLATTPTSFRKWIRSRTTRARGTAQHQRKATESPPSNLLRLRQPTPVSSTATTLEFDPRPSFEDGELCHAPLPFPTSAKDILNVIPVNGIDLELLDRRFRISSESQREYQKYSKLVWRVCLYDGKLQRLVPRQVWAGLLDLAEDEDGSPDEMDLC
jgi:hypothetical protein